MRTHALLPALLLGALLPSAGRAEAKLVVEVRENDRHGPLLKNVFLRATGASPTFTKDAGQAVFAFPSLHPGDATSITLVPPSDWEIVNSLELVRLPTAPEANPYVLVVSRPATSRERTQKDIKGLLSSANEARYERTVRELQGEKAAMAGALEAAERERDENGARLELVAIQLAESKSHTAEVVAAYQSASSASNERFTAELARLSALLEQGDRDAGRMSSRLAGGTLSARHVVLTAMPSASLIDGAVHPGFWLAAETLAPGEGFLGRLSVLVELGGVHWKETPSFTALPGTRPVSYDRTNLFLTADTAARHYIPVKGAARLWAGAAIGVLTQPEYGWSELGWAVHGTAGAFIFAGRMRFGLELRVSELQTRSREWIFDPFGNFQTDDRRRFRPALTAGIHVAPVLW